MMQQRLHSTRPVETILMFVISVDRVFTNYLITESELVTGNSQTEASSPYWPSASEVNTIGLSLRFSHNDRLRLNCLLYGTQK